MIGQVTSEKIKEPTQSKYSNMPTESHLQFETQILVKGKRK